MTKLYETKLYNEIINALLVAIREKRNYALQIAQEKSNEQTSKFAQALIENAKADGVQEAMHMVINYINDCENNASQSEIKCQQNQ